MNFIDLNLFTEATSKRMNDRGFVEELLGYLKLGIQEKRSPVETLLENDIIEEDYENLKNTIEQIRKNHGEIDFSLIERPEII